jgi:basic membrane protein A and related proteins
MIVNEIAGSYSVESRKNCPAQLQIDTFSKVSPPPSMLPGAFRLAAVAALLLAGAVGCSPRDQSKVRPASFRVALLTPGPVSDAGWNAAAFDGLQLIKTRLGAEGALVQTTSPADFEDAFRDFAGRGFNLIFAHGFEYTDAALKVAKLFPNTVFVVTSGSASSQNVASLTFKIEEAAYVEGVIAGAVSKTGVAGAVGGIELPAIRLTFEGFRRGFQSARPGGRVLVSYIGSFEDVGAAKEAALAQISQGADLMFHNADAAGLGVFQAASQAHIFAFGANRNQNDVAPDVVLASAVTDIPQAFLKIAAAVKKGDFHPAMIEFGMRDEMVKVVMNPRLVSRIPPRALPLAKASEDQIKSGKITFPSPAALGRSALSARPEAPAVSSDRLRSGSPPPAPVRRTHRAA